MCAKRASMHRIRAARTRSSSVHERGRLEHETRRRPLEQPGAALSPPHSKGPRLQSSDSDTKCTAAEGGGCANRSRSPCSQSFSTCRPLSACGGEGAPRNAFKRARTSGSCRVFVCGVTPVKVRGPAPCQRVLPACVASPVLVSCSARDFARPVSSPRKVHNFLTFLGPTSLNCLLCTAVTKTTNVFAGRFLHSCAPRILQMSFSTNLYWKNEFRELI